MTKDTTPHAEALQALLEEARQIGESPSAQRRHHIVPAFYLRHWAEGGKLRVTNIDEQKSWPATPRRAATESDYYRIDSPDLDPNEIPPLLYEVTLSKVEKWGASFIEAAIADSLAVLRDTEQRVLFSIYMAFQYVRGRNFRAMSHAATNDYFRLAYGQITDAGARQLLESHGQEATDEAITDVRQFAEKLNSGRIEVGPQKAALIGMSGELVEQIGSLLFTRHWHIYTVPPILVTSDEPVVPIAGPSRPRTERGGIGNAGVVIFPLTPGLLLAAFDGVNAGTTPSDQLSHADIAELNREIVASSSVYAFDRPSRKTATAFKLPPAPSPAKLGEPMPTLGSDEEGFLIRGHRPSRWAAESNPPPWPVERWFYTDYLHG